MKSSIGFSGYDFNNPGNGYWETITGLDNTELEPGLIRRALNRALLFGAGRADLVLLTIPQDAVHAFSHGDNSMVFQRHHLGQVDLSSVPHVRTTPIEPAVPGLISGLIKTATDIGAIGHIKIAGPAETRALLAKAPVNPAIREDGVDMALSGWYANTIVSQGVDPVYFDALSRLAGVYLGLRMPNVNLTRIHPWL